MKYEKQAIVQKLNWPGNAKRMDFGMGMTLELHFPIDLITVVVSNEVQLLRYCT